MNVESYFPQYPEKREISINDKDLLKQKLFKLQPQISEYTFTNLWIWRQHRLVYLSQLDDNILIFRKNLDGQIFLLPPVGEETSLHVFEKMRSKGVEDLNSLYGFSKEEANKFKEKKLVPDLIKIDVEGAEMKVLNGMKSVLENNNVKLFVEVHPIQLLFKFQSSANAVISMLIKNGYHVFEITNMRGRGKNAGLIKLNQESQLMRNTMIYAYKKESSP